MSHLTELQLSMLADGALEDAEHNQLDAHVRSCDTCSARVAAVTQEQVLLKTSFQAESDSSAVPIPPFKRPAGIREFALANVITALVIWLAGFLWKTLFGEVIVNTASWLTSLVAPDTYQVVSGAVLYYLQEGTSMLDAYLGFIVFSIVALTCAALVLRYRKQAQSLSLSFTLCICAVLGGSLVAPGTADALEVRRSDAAVTVAAGEVIDDTLIAGAETVVIRGEVTGDLIAAGRRVQIEGNVHGNLLAFAENVSISGSVGGLLLSAGSQLQITGAQVGGNLWLAGNKLDIDRAASVGQNAVLAGERLVVQGDIGKDLLTFAELVELDGTVNEDLEAFGNRVRLLGDARIVGDATLRLPEESALERAATATVGGQVVFADMPDEFRDDDELTLGQKVLWQLARIISAVLSGLVLYWLFPQLRTLALPGGMEGIKTAGVGLLALIATPIAVVLIGVTLIGLPVAIVTFLGWLLLIYLSKIVVGMYVGQSLLGGTRHGDSVLLPLLVGIALIVLLLNIPVLGGVLNLVLVAVGLGLLVQRLLAGVAR